MRGRASNATHAGTRGNTREHAGNTRGTRGEHDPLVTGLWNVLRLQKRPALMLTSRQRSQTPRNGCPRIPTQENTGTRGNLLVDSLLVPLPIQIPASGQVVPLGRSHGAPGIRERDARAGHESAFLHPPSRPRATSACGMDMMDESLVIEGATPPPSPATPHSVKRSFGPVPPRPDDLPLRSFGHAMSPPLLKLLEPGCSPFGAPEMGLWPHVEGAARI